MKSSPPTSGQSGALGGVPGGKLIPDIGTGFYMPVGSSIQREWRAQRLCLGGPRPAFVLQIPLAGRGRGGHVGTGASGEL